jgi:transposase
MYQNFIGIDISKKSFSTALYGDRNVFSFENNPAGFEDFKKTYESHLSNALVVLETTGGYEAESLAYLQTEHIAVHRANARKVKYFIRSLGVSGKSDNIDAMGLARYAAERHATLEVFVENPYKSLSKWVERRDDLSQMLVQEKNRLKAPDQTGLAKSFEKIIAILEAEIIVIDKEIECLFEKHKDLQSKRQVLETIPGIGKIVSAKLLALLPELGKLDRKAIASLAGVAPHPYESGQKVGYRPTRGGRPGVKRTLFIAAFSACKSKSNLGDFYRNLVDKSGKKKMVALVAVMRKIVVIANARIKQFDQNELSKKHS